MPEYYHPQDESIRPRTAQGGQAVGVYNVNQSVGDGSMGAACENVPTEIDSPYASHLKSEHVPTVNDSAYSDPQHAHDGHFLVDAHTGKRHPYFKNSQGAIPSAVVPVRFPMQDTPFMSNAAATFTGSGAPIAPAQELLFKGGPFLAGLFERLRTPGHSVSYTHCQQDAQDLIDPSHVENVA